MTQETHGAFRTYGCRVNPARLAEANGCIAEAAPLTLAAVTDGLSHTAVVAEQAITICMPLDVPRDGEPILFQSSGRWFSGEPGSTLITTFCPPNAHRRFASHLWKAWSWSASSLHPVGLTS